MKCLIYFITVCLTGSICLFSCQQAQAQEILSNGGFEKLKRCPDNVGQLYLSESWYNVNTPDLHSSCNGSSPKNFMGNMEPHSGNTYAGFYLLGTTTDVEESTKNSFYQREYIRGRLKQPLVKGQLYTVSFYVSLASKSGFYSDRFSVKLSKKKPRYVNQNYTLLRGGRHTVITDVSKLSHSFVWEQVSFIYKARGGEKYITFGLFNKDMSHKTCLSIMQTNSVDDLPGPCYYYIDDVSITPVTQYTRKR